MMNTFIRHTMILGAVFGLASGLWAQEPDPFEEKFSYSDSRELGERLVVSFPKAETEFSRSLEMIIFDESYYNQSSFAYDTRQVAIFSGMGMGSSGLKIVLNDHSQRSQFVSVLDRFVKVFNAYAENEKDLTELRQDWMGDGWKAINVPRRLGKVYFYPNKKPIEATFNFDPSMGRVWLDMDSRVFMDEEVVPYILRMINNIPAYQDKLVSLRKELGNTNDQIDRTVGADRVRAKL